MTTEGPTKAETAGPVRARKRRVWRWCLPGALVLAAAGILWSGAHRTATGTLAGTSLNGSSSAPIPGRILRVGIFNIDGGVGRSGKEDLDLTADCVRGLDLVGLNEVHGGSLTEHRDQAELLGTKVGLPWLFAPTEMRWWREAFGNGVLSRAPVTAWKRIPLPRVEGHSFRNVTLLDVSQAGKTLHVLVTHLGFGRNRSAQFAVVRELFLASEEPAILMGDLNGDQEDPLIQQLLASPGVQEPAKLLSSAASDRKRCWIFTRGLKCLDAGLLDRGASDHSLVWATLEIPP